MEYSVTREICFLFDQFLPVVSDRFQYEGTFRQAIVYKGRSRDTTWFSIIDRDWPVVRAAFEAWLAPENFDTDGKQIRSLAELRSRG